VLSEYEPFEFDRRHLLMKDKMEHMSVMERVRFSMNEYANALQEGKTGISNLKDDQTLGGLDHNYHRKLEDAARQGTLFDGCIFKHNKQGKRGGDEKFGIITVPFGFDDLELKDCIFFDNQYGEASDKVRCEI
jgi:hypothetical protein